MRAVLAHIRLAPILLAACLAIVAGRLAALPHLDAMRVDQTVAVIDIDRVPGLDFGMPGAVAAFLWLRMVAQTGEWTMTRHLREQQFDILARQTDALIRLDPYAPMLVDFASAVLGSLGNKVYETHVILLRSLRGQIANWKVYFALGLLYYKRYGDLDRAAEWWKLAAIQPNVGPKYLANLAQFIRLKKTGHIDDLLADFDLQTLPLPELRKEWEEIYRFRELQSQLRYGLQTFFRRYGRYPTSIQEVVAAGIWWRHPVDPWGGLVVLSDDGTTILPSNQVPIAPRVEKTIAVDPRLDRGILPDGR